MLRRVGWAIGMVGLAAWLGGCAAGVGGPRSRQGEYRTGPAGPGSWDPATGTSIDPFSGHPIRGGSQ